MSEITKRVLDQSLHKLVQRKPLEDITISDLIADCGISRSTFYYHFHDLNDLIEWSLTNHFSKILGQNKTYTTWQEGFKKILHEIYSQKDFISVIYTSMDHTTLDTYLEHVAFELLMNVLNEKDEDNHVPDEKKQFIANFYKRGFVGIVVDWIKSNFRQDPDVLITDLENILHGSFLHALDVYR